MGRSTIAQSSPVHDGRPAVAQTVRRFPASSLITWLLVGYLVLVPLGFVVAGAFRDGGPGAATAFTLDSFRAILETDRLGVSLWNTGVFATASTLIAVPLGGYLAWLAERTDAPLRRTIYALALAPLLVPGILTTVAWSVTLNEQIGILNAASVAVFGVDLVPFEARSMAGMIWADATDSIALPFLLLVAAFRSMDPAMEEASLAAGAGRMTTFVRVTLPVLRPALAATVLITFIKTVDTFEVPALLGIPAQIPLLATDVYLATQRAPSQPNVGAAYGVVYLLITAVAVVAYNRVTRDSSRFVTITGRGYRPARIELGRSRRPHAIGAAVILALTVLLPYLVIVYTSLLSFYRPPSLAVVSELGFDQYRDVLFESSVILRAVLNNLVAGVGAAFAATALAVAVSWLVVRGRSRWRFLLDGVATAPIAVPGIVLGLALVWVYLSFPNPIYASLWLIAIGYVTAFLPYAVRTTSFALTQIDRELEEASAASGAPPGTTLRRVTVPLLTGGLIVGFVYVLSRTLKVLSLPVLLGGPGNEVIPVVIFDLAESAQYPQLAALGVLLVGLLTLLGGAALAVARTTGLLALLTGGR